jgi:hypothetical protein
MLKFSKSIFFLKEQNFVKENQEYLIKSPNIIYNDVWINIQPTWSHLGEIQPLKTLSISLFKSQKTIPWQGI